MAELPEDFNADGLLPPGEYEVTVPEIRASLLVQGPKNAPAEWDGAWRNFLLGQAEILANQLWDIGLTEIYLNGSFVEDKPHPNDIDGYFVCDVFLVANGDLERQLNALDPHKAWTWDPRSRKPYRGYAKRQLPMWHVYRVELYPHYGQLSGIKDQHGNDMMFPAAFRRRRSDDASKGIVKLLRS